MEQLNKSLQSASVTISGMIAAAETFVLELRRLRSENQFSIVFKEFK
jgi:hypothetical protein